MVLFIIINATLSFPIQQDLRKPNMVSPAKSIEVSFGGILILLTLVGPRNYVLEWRHLANTMGQLENHNH